MQNSAGDLFYSAGGDGKIYISSDTNGVNTGNSGYWTDITPSGSWGRIEVGVSKKSGSGVIYAACQGSSSNDVTGLYFSDDKGSNWTSRSVPTICDQGDNSKYTRNQAWYDQVVAIDPNYDSVVYIGGIDLIKSTDKGANWN